LARGSAILTVMVPDDRAERVKDFLEARGADVDKTATSPPAESRAGVSERDNEVIPVVEERLKIGKRPISRGGVRVYTRITERPIEEQVRLREEQISVERRPVDRPASAADEAFRDREIEVIAT